MTQQPPTWDSKAYRATVRRDRDRGVLRRHTARTLLSAIDLADRHRAALPDPQGERINFVGLGLIRGALAEIPGSQYGDFYFVHEVLDVSGATVEQWEQLRDEEIEECRTDGIPPRVDAYTLHGADGDTVEVPVANWQMALQLALEGPWGKEIMENLMPSFRRAAVETGVGDLFPVVRVGADGIARGTGETLTDVILADGPLPSAEVARHQAAAGPLAALHTTADGR